jgi:hypothetical protein
MLLNLQPRSALDIFGLLSITLSFPFVLRLIYEETILTWNQGWQMVGFSVAHVFPLLLIMGGLGIIGMHIFLAIWLGRLLLDRVRARNSSPRNMALAAVAGILILLVYIPYSSWIALLVRTGGPGNQGVSFLRFAVSDNNERLARLLLKKGVPVDGRYSGDTALNAACVGKDLEIAHLLLSSGADLKNAPACVWVPEISGKPRPFEVPSTSITVTP